MSSQPAERALAGASGGGRAAQLDAFDDAELELDASVELINRDLSDLAFVQRVLEEAENSRNPVLERARFLAITGMLLDEFYRIRVAALREQIRSHPKLRSRDGTKPSKQLKRADRYSNRLTIRQDRCWRQLRSDLEAEGVELLTRRDLDAAEKAWLASQFDKRIRPRLVPLTGDVKRALESIRNGSLFLFAEIAPADASAIARPAASASVAAELAAEDAPAAAAIEPLEPLGAIVPIPVDLPRFVALPRGDRLLPIEEIVHIFIDELFPDATVTASGLARILREGSLKPFRDGDDLLRLVCDAIERRERADVIRLRVERGMPERLTRALAEALGLLEPEQIKALEKSRRRATASEFVVADSFLGLPDLLELVAHVPTELAARLQYPSVAPAVPAFLTEFDGDLFRAIAAKERLVHFPYEDFDVVVRLLRQAVGDSAVVRIRQTLYRTDSGSPVIRALADAARRGKSVDVVVELEARDDETRNVELATLLRSAGVRVSFGAPGLKVHAKLLIIDRVENDAMRRYVHWSTGNYNAVAARHYTDLCLFSAADGLGEDAERLFAYVQDGSVPSRLERIAIAPLGLRERVAELIETEIGNAAAGRPAAIWLKLNRLSDTRLIRLLYRASQAGVDVRIVVRGICCLRPGVPGLSERIAVKSVVGRHLEHSRALCFGNGHALPSDAAAVFITSADLMTHKLDRRIEALVAIDDADLKRRIQYDVFEPYFRDATNSWVLGADDAWQRSSFEGFNVQQALFGLPLTPEINR